MKLNKYFFEEFKQVFEEYCDLYGGAFGGYEGFTENELLSILNENDMFLFNMGEYLSIPQIHLFMDIFSETGYFLWDLQKEYPTTEYNINPPVMAFHKKNAECWLIDIRKKMLSELISSLEPEQPFKYKKKVTMSIGNEKSSDDKTQYIYYTLIQGNIDKYDYGYRNLLNEKKLILRSEDTDYILDSWNHVKVFDEKLPYVAVINTKRFWLNNFDCNMYKTQGKAYANLYDDLTVTITLFPTDKIQKMSYIQIVNEDIDLS